MTFAPLLALACRALQDNLPALDRVDYCDILARLECVQNFLELLDALYLRRGILWGNNLWGNNLYSRRGATCTRFIPSSGTHCRFGGEEDAPSRHETGHPDARENPPEIFLFPRFSFLPVVVRP